LPFRPRLAAHRGPLPVAFGFYARGEAAGRLAEVLRAADGGALTSKGVSLSVLKACEAGVP